MDGRTITLALALAGAAGPGACSPDSGRQQAEEKPAIERQGEKLVIPAGSPLRERLKVGAVKEQSLQRHLTAPAVVEAEPSKLAKITPPVSGKVVRLFVKFGDSVKKGQPLLSMDAPDLVQAQSDYLRAKSSLGQAERTLARQQDLASHGIGARREVEQAETERDNAKAELERSLSRLKLLKVDTSRIGEPLAVRSPIDGRVVDLAVTPGEFKNDPNAVLMIVADLETIWVTANVQEKDIRRVHKNDEATAMFAAYPGEKFTGKVLIVSDLLDPETHAIKVRVAFQNDEGRLKPGMFATTTFASTAAEEVVVPSTALVLIGDKNYVFVETAPWTFERRAVEVEETQGSVTVVRSGVQAGNRIVVKDAVLLQ
jgi:cobalt-zinc-cadmium efflux system membrane fusion protein